MHVYVYVFLSVFNLGSCKPAKGMYY